MRPQCKPAYLECGQCADWRGDRIRDAGVGEGGVLEVGDPLRHAGDASDEVAVGDHDALGDPRGAAGVHDDSDAGGDGLHARSGHCVG